jgi:hypothetical protein
MAPHTGGWDAFVFVSNVTCHALNFRVAPLQFKLRILVVIEPNVLPSAGRAH